MVTTPSNGPDGRRAGRSGGMRRAAMLLEARKSFVAYAARLDARPASIAAMAKNNAVA